MARQCTPDGDFDPIPRAHRRMEKCVEMLDDATTPNLVVLPRQETQYRGDVMPPLTAPGFPVRTPATSTPVSQPQGQTTVSQPAVEQGVVPAPANPGSVTAKDAVTRGPGSNLGSVPLSKEDSDAKTRQVLQAFFCPYDNPIQQDLACIREVIDARKADSRTFPPGKNPYSIKYAVYNLRHPDVVKALEEAHRAGVDVQILIEKHQLDPEKTWNTTDEELIAAGFKFSPTQKGLTEEQKKELNLIGIETTQKISGNETRGLMHLKTRIFSYLDPKTHEPVEKLLTGSMNPGDEAYFNNETLHLITDPHVIARYKAKYDAVLNDTPLANEWKEDAPINVLFTRASGPQPADKLLELIDQEQEAIFISVFSLRDITSPHQREGLVEKLKKAKARGVEVVVVTDRKQSDGVDRHGNRIGYDDPTEDRLKAAGIPVYECINTSSDYTAMHNKCAVFGLKNMKVVTDAGNWTAAAMGSKKKPAVNDESYLFIDSGRLDHNTTGLRYLSNFLYLLRTYQHQQDDAPRAREMVERFAQLPNWPRVKVDFEVFAKTYFGQEVYLTGNHPALGDWTKAGPGLKLKTSGASYPLWRNDASLELPFGTALEFKVVKKDDKGRLEWAGDKNQLLVVDPADLRTDGADLSHFHIDRKVKT